MKVVVLSDIHGNLPAFEKVLSAEAGADLFVSLGDVVNYGPWSNECVDLLESIKAISLKGNHEEYFIVGKFPGKNELVHQFFDFCHNGFSRNNQILAYRDEYMLEGYTCRHTIGDLYLFPETKIELDANYLVGHSHVQFINEQKGFRLVNVGSVGQNRREINVINYAIFDTGKKQVTLKQELYDVQPVIQKMKEMKYPAACVAYYINKPLRES